MKQKSIIVIHHRSQNTPSRILNQSCLGLMGHSLVKQGMTLREYSIHDIRSDALNQADALIITGAMESVNEKLAWIEKERMLIRQAIEQDVPILGICFGAQNLAHTFGATIEKMPRPIVQLVDVSIGSNTGLLENLPASFKAVGIHQDHIVPDAEMNVLATSGGVVSAFSYHERFFGVQFHPELTQQLLFDLIDKRVKMQFGLADVVEDSVRLKASVVEHANELAHVANCMAVNFVSCMKEKVE